MSASKEGITQLAALASEAPAPRGRGMGLWLQRIRGWLLGGVLLAAYVLADPATSLFPHPRFGVQPMSPHPALALALLLPGLAPAPALGAAVLVAWWLTAPSALQWTALPAALATVAVYALAATALRRWARWHQAQIGPRDVNVLLLVGLPLAGACALIEALRQISAPDLPATALPLLTLRQFVADTLGLVVLAPLALRLTGMRAPFAPWLRPRVLRDAAVFLTVLAALLYLVFGLQLLDDYRMSYLLFLPMIVVAMRYGVCGVAAALPIVQLGLLWALMHAGTRAGLAFEFQLLMVTLAVAALYLGALSDERQRAAARIAAHERTLRERGLALAEAQRLASTAELAAALAHDLSQPLSAIGTYASASQVLARRGPDAQPQLLDTLEQVARESARAGQYLRRMRDFFRTGVMHEECIAAAGLIEQALAHLHDRMVRGRIHCRVTVAADLPPISADAVHVGAVLGNLLGNACDALESTGEPRHLIVLAAVVPDADPPMVRISIEDSGPGIAEDLRARLFMPLATTKPNGMGLGLALSRSIAERQGGRLWYDAQAPRTRFCLDLRIHG